MGRIQHIWRVVLILVGWGWSRRPGELSLAIFYHGLIGLIAELPLSSPVQLLAQAVLRKKKVVVPRLFFVSESRDQRGCCNLSFLF